MNFTSTSGKLIFIIILLIAALAIIPLSKLKFNYDVESYFKKKDPKLLYYHNFRETFENDNDFILIGIHNEPDIFEQSFLTKIDSLTQTITKLDLVEYVNSPSNLKRFIIDPLGTPIEIPLIHIDDTRRYSADSTRIYESANLIGSYFSEDAQSISIYIKKEEFTDKHVNDELLNNLYKIIETYHFQEFHLAGRIRTQNYYVSQMNNEIIKFAVASIILMILYLLIAFRSLLGIVVPLLVIGISVILALAVIQITGYQMDLIMTTLPSLLFIIGISTSVHLISRFTEEIGTGKNKSIGLRNTVNEIGRASFLAAFTTAIGFIALLVIDIPPIRYFGVYTAIGVLLTFIISIILIPVSRQTNVDRLLDC
ncbi:MAG: MMPL family transporter [Bacteroidetes bacterium]|nr:MMPL family transporter [Bacteroidota bacterium]